MNKAILSKLIIGLVLLGCIPFYIYHSKAKVSRVSYCVTILGIVFVGLAFLMSAGVRYLALTGDESGRWWLFRLSTITGLSGTAALIFSMFNNGFSVKSYATKYDRSVLLIHKRLSIIYVVMPIVLVICFDRNVGQFIGLNSRSILTMLGNRNIVLMHSGLFILLMLQTIFLVLLWLTGNAERTVLSRYSIIAPPIIFGILCVALYIPIWLHIRWLLISGLIWPSDIRGNIIFIAQWVVLSVFLNSFAWHALMGSGYYGDRCRMRQNG
jgi:hypothetical protein